MRFQFTFALFAGMEMRRTLKRLYYAHLYGNYNGQQAAKDFLSMYCMGGEL